MEGAANDNSSLGKQFYDSARACRLAAGNYDIWTAGVLRRHARLQEMRGRALAKMGIGGEPEGRLSPSQHGARLGGGGRA